MENYEQEKAFLEAEGIENGQWVTFIDEHQQPEKLRDVLLKYKVHLIEQANEGKLTLQECAEKASFDTFGHGYFQCLSMLDEDDLQTLIINISELFANQFIPVASVEKLTTITAEEIEERSENYVKGFDWPDEEQRSCAKQAYIDCLESENTSTPAKVISDEELFDISVNAYCKHSEVDGFIFTTFQGRCSQDESNGYCMGYQNGHTDGIKWMHIQLTPKP